MTTKRTRFGAIPAWAAGLLLCLLLLISAYGISTSIRPAASEGPATVDLTDTDIALYRAIAGRVRAGENYYRAAVAEQRARGYPLKPAFTVRLPTLAWTVGVLGEQKTGLLLKLLALGGMLAFSFRIRPVAGSRLEWAAASVLTACGVVLLTIPAMTFWHESWAALFIILSLSVRTEKLWLPSVLLGLVAVLLRELAFPFLGVMALLAWRERGRAEAAAWASAALIALAAIIVHASTLSGYVNAGDLASPGWSGGGGWRFVVGMMQLCSLFLFLPLGVVAVLVPLALIGWASLRGQLASRIVFLLFGYIAGFTLLGRPDNFYWGILIAPLLPIGLAFAPRALREIWGSLGILNPSARKIAG